MLNCPSYFCSPFFKAFDLLYTWALWLPLLFRRSLKHTTGRRAWSLNNFPQNCNPHPLEGGILYYLLCPYKFIIQSLIEGNGVNRESGKILKPLNQHDSFLRSEEKSLTIKWYYVSLLRSHGDVILSASRCIWQTWRPLFDLSPRQGPALAVLPATNIQTRPNKVTVAKLIGRPEIHVQACFAQFRGQHPLQTVLAQPKR